ncbi:hypothetical protein ABBQ32_001066 [Trebouxia sp. C0010 RCD-2024]
MVKIGGFEVPDQTGKVAIVTGGNSGIGFHAAKGLACAGAHVIIAARRAEACQEAVDDINNAVGMARSKGWAEYMTFDLCSLESVRDFVEEFKKKEIPLNMLFNNAGEWMREDNTYTKEGFQIMIGVQHFAHFFLTMLLVDKLKASAPARIIFTSSASEATAQQDIPWDNLGGEGCVHSDFTAYSNAKLYNQLTAVELQKRLEGTGVDIYVAQPGMSKTGLFAKGDHSKWGVFFQDWMQYLQGLPADVGAIPLLLCATKPDLPGKGGQLNYGPYYTRFPFIFPNITNINPYASQTPRGPHATDEPTARRLFDESVKVINGKLPADQRISVLPPKDQQTEAEDLQPEA